MTFKNFFNSQKGTNIYYRSEFRKNSLLKKILQFHSDRTRVTNVLENGTDTSLKEIKDAAIFQDKLNNMERGNHKSSFKSIKEVEFINKVYSKEVSRGWMIPILPSTVKNLKNSNVIPIGVVSQMTIDEDNNPKEKLRLTHDCSWIGPSSSHSLNSRINEELLAPLQYGRCMYRVLHAIQHL